MHETTKYKGHQIRLNAEKEGHEKGRKNEWKKKKKENEENIEGIRNVGRKNVSQKRRNGVTSQIRKRM